MAIDPRYDVIFADSVILTLWKVYTVLDEANRSLVCHYALEQWYKCTDTSATLLNRCIIYHHWKSRLKPEPAWAEPCLTAWAGLEVSMSPSQCKPSPSHGFEPKPGWHITHGLCQVSWRYLYLEPWGRLYNSMEMAVGTSVSWTQKEQDISHLEGLADGDSCR